MLRFYGLLLGVLLAGTATAQTTFDPSFLPQQIYAAGTVVQALQLSDGSRLVAGSFTRAEGRASVGLEHYLATGLADPVFAANVASYQFMVQEMAEAPTGKLVLRLQGYPIVVGSLLNPAVARLQANGTVDASFTPPSIVLASILTSNTPAMRDLLVQPDGKVVLAGQLVQVAGQPASGLTRLNTDGTLDAAFQQATTANGGFQLGSVYAPSGPAVSFVVQQPDGKLLVGGDFATVQGHYQPRLARLLPTGEVDATFVADTSPNYTPAAAALLPNGSILVSGLSRVLAASNQPLVRLSATGVFDRTFVVSALPVLEPMMAAIMSSGALQVQPDGRVLVALRISSVGGPMFIARFTPTGSLDPTWTVPFYRDFSPPSSMQLLPNGQVLTGCYRRRYGSALAGQRSTGVLNADGSYDASFAPALRMQGTATVALQADGKLIVGGDFVEINGHAAANLARLNSDGTVDGAFTDNCPAVGPGEVRQVLVQPDGKILAGGIFTAVAGQPHEGVVRLLPTGLPDPGFQSPIASTPLGGTTDIYRLALQADGNLLVNGQMLVPAAGSPNFGQQLIRLLGTTGAVDAGFQAAVQAPLALLPRPDGTLIAAVGTGFTSGTPPAAPVVRMLADGSLDPAFETNVTGLINRVFCLAAYPDGRLLAGGTFNGFGTAGAASTVVRLLPNGSPDPSFLPNLGNAASARQLLFQPNGRLLVAGTFPQTGGTTPKVLVRLLANGLYDTGFSVPLTSYLPSTALLVQPNGAIVLSGPFFTSTGNTPVALARLLDANVLAMAGSQSQSLTAAYPVPAHGWLHLRLDAASQPQQVQLLDGLGRCVRSWPVAPAAELLTLDTNALPTGPYLLRVQYAKSGPIIRRIVLE